MATAIALHCGSIVARIAVNAYGGWMKGTIPLTGCILSATLRFRLQNMKTINGKPEYSGAGDVVGRILKNEGFFALWKGFTPYYFRIGPHTVLTFIFLEQLTGAYYKYVLKSEKGASM